MELRLSTIKEAFKEPINIGMLLLAGAAAAHASLTGSIIQPSFILSGAMMLEGLYLATIPQSSFYRKILERRKRNLLTEQKKRQREAMIRKFDPREREAIKYLSWLKNQIADNYKKFTGVSGDPHHFYELETTYEAFIDLLDEYRRRKNHLKMTNRQTVENQLRQAERAAQYADPSNRPLLDKNVEILRKRLKTFDDIERSVKRVEAQLQMIENFFNLVNDQIVTMPTSDQVMNLDFDTLLESIEITKEILQQTAPVMAQLDVMNRTV